VGIATIFAIAALPCLQQLFAELGAMKIWLIPEV
jgi:hypothetical protein